MVCQEGVLDEWFKWNLFPYSLAGGSSGSGGSGSSGSGGSSGSSSGGSSSSLSNYVLDFV
jgi:hypothetical protein